MRGWFRRIRGAIGVGLTWAVGWGLGGGLIWLVRTFAEFGVDVALFLGAQYALIVFLGGVTFSARRTRFDQLRIPTFAGWGGLGGLLIGAVYLAQLWTFYGGGPDAATLEFLAITTLFGAGSAGGSLALARLADDGRLLEQGQEASGVGLSDVERRSLLGESAR